jgi:hypothetical protein
MSEALIFFHGYQPSGEFAAFSDFMGERFALSRSQCEQRLHTLQSRGRDCPVTEAVLQEWPTRQVGGLRGQVPEHGGRTIGGSMAREKKKRQRASGYGRPALTAAGAL